MTIQPLPRMHAVLVGRIPGREPRAIEFVVPNLLGTPVMRSALREFPRKLYEAEGLTYQHRKAVKKLHGVDAIIDFTIVNETPMAVI